MRACLALIILVTSGCASMFSKPSYNVRVTSYPSDANYSVKNRSGTVVCTGKTPTVEKLKAGSGFRRETYIIKCSKEGHDPGEAYMRARLSQATWFNYFNGWIGCLIDRATGSMWELPDQVFVELAEKEVDDSKVNRGQEINALLGID